MKIKPIWMTGTIAVVAIILTIVVVMLTGHKTAAPQSSQSFNSPKACDVLTKAIAQKLSIGVADKQELPNQGTVSISISSCAYYDSKANVLIGLVVRGAKDAVGANTNKAQFANLPTYGMLVPGYGDKAYWDMSFGQLNILKHNNWYIVVFGGTKLASRTVDETKKAANLIIDKL